MHTVYSASCHRLPKQPTICTDLYTPSPWYFNIFSGFDSASLIPHTGFFFFFQRHWFWWTEKKKKKKAVNTFRHLKSEEKLILLTLKSLNDSWVGCYDFLQISDWAHVGSACTVCTLQPTHAKEADGKDAQVLSLPSFLTNLLTFHSRL